MKKYSHQLLFSILAFIIFIYVVNTINVLIVLFLGLLLCIIPVVLIPLKYFSVGSSLVQTSIHLRANVEFTKQGQKELLNYIAKSIRLLRTPHSISVINMIVPLSTTMYRRAIVILFFSRLTKEFIIVLPELYNGNYITINIDYVLRKESTYFANKVRTNLFEAQNFVYHLKSYIFKGIDNFKTIHNINIEKLKVRDSK